MSTVPPISDDERAQLGAEYALGLLEGDELLRAQSLFHADPAFREEAGRWLGRLGPLLDEIEPVEPPAGLWARIERGLSEQSTPNHAANDNVHVLRRRLSMWRGAAAGATAIAASLALLMFARPEAITPPVATAPAQPPMVSILGDEQQPARLVANWDPSSRRLIVAQAGDIPASPDRSHELWVIPADGRPRSLGIMPAAPRMSIYVQEAMSHQLQQGSTLAVSVEPVGGSRTGLPTGPVIASGKLERV